MGLILVLLTFQYGWSLFLRTAYNNMVDIIINLALCASDLSTYTCM